MTHWREQLAALCSPPFEKGGVSGEPRSGPVGRIAKHRAAFQTVSSLRDHLAAESSCTLPYGDILFPSPTLLSGRGMKGEGRVPPIGASKERKVHAFENALRISAGRFSQRCQADQQNDRLSEFALLKGRTSFGRSRLYERRVRQKSGRLESFFLPFLSFQEERNGDFHFLLFPLIYKDGSFSRYIHSSTQIFKILEFISQIAVSRNRYNKSTLHVSL